MTLQELVVRFWEDLAARPSGPLALRFLLQPTMASILAVRAGLEDAKTGRTPYLSTIVRDPNVRRARIREGWHATAKVFCLAVVLDMVYQLITFKTVHPLETVTVAFVLACLPYLLIRGPAARLARWHRARHPRAAH
jgi:hypothetical protein